MSGVNDPGGRRWPGQFIPGIVTGVDLDARGRMVASVITQGGGVYFGVHVMAGDLQDLSLNDEVALHWPPGRAGRPVIKGILKNEPPVERLTKKDSPAQGPIPDLSSIKDKILRSGGSRLIGSSNGWFGVDVARSDKDFKVQLGPTGRVRIGHTTVEEDGAYTEAAPVDERVVLGRALLGYTKAELVDHINALQERLMQLEAALLAMTGPLSALPGGAAAAAPLQAHLQAPFAPTPAAAPGDELLSAAFALSSKGGG